MVRCCYVLLDEKMIYLNDKTLTASFTDRINLREDLAGGGSIRCLGGQYCVITDPFC